MRENWFGAVNTSIHDSNAATGDQLAQSIIRQSVAVPLTITSPIRKSGQNVPQIALMQGKASLERVTPFQSPKAGHDAKLLLIATLTVACLLVGEAACESKWRRNE